MAGDDDLEIAIDSQLAVVTLLEPGAGFHDAAFGIGKIALSFVVRNAIVPFEVPPTARRPPLVIRMPAFRVIGLRLLRFQPSFCCPDLA